MKYIIVLLSIICVVSSCKKFIEVDPSKSEILNDLVFSNDATATSAIRGIYSLMMTGQVFTNAGIEQYTGLSADELSDFSGNAAQIEFADNSLQSNNTEVLNIFWKPAYAYINNANTIIEGLDNSTQVSAAVKSQLKGEALFIRAFTHFYLVNLFGDIPYITSTDYRINSAAHRMRKDSVYTNIIADLTMAADLMSDDYSFSQSEKIQPNKWAAIALLARVYLYNGNWEKAQEMADAVIDDAGIYALETDLNNVFLANSGEAIWQLQPVVPEMSTGQGTLFILVTPPSSVALNDDLLMSFENGDIRKTQWTASFTDENSITYNYSSKYKVYSAASFTEYSTVLRLAEQYLIRAEAKIQQDNIAEGINDLNMLRGRARDVNPGDLPDLANTLSKEDALQAVENERRAELFTEWGHRWLDLKRTDRANTIMPLLKPDWQSEDQLYPIPESERLTDPNLTQNPNY